MLICAHIHDVCDNNTEQKVINLGELEGFKEGLSERARGKKGGEKMI